MYNVSLLLHFFLFFLDCLFIKNRTCTFWYVQFARGLDVQENTQVVSDNDRYTCFTYPHAARSWLGHVK